MVSGRGGRELIGRVSRFGWSYSETGCGGVEISIAAVYDLARRTGLYGLLGMDMDT